MPNSRVFLKKAIIPCLGELHTAMAALRALRSSIENSSIDEARQEQWNTTTSQHLTEPCQKQPILCPCVHVSSLTSGISRVL